MDDIEEESDSSPDILHITFNPRALEEVKDDRKELCTDGAELIKIIEVHNKMLGKNSSSILLIWTEKFVVH